MRRKLTTLFLLAAILLLSIGATTSQIRLTDFGHYGLAKYLEAANGQPTYVVLIALDLAQGRDITAPQTDVLLANAAMLDGDTTLSAMLSHLGDNLRMKVERELPKLSYLCSVVENKRFPLLPSVTYSYWNDWGQERLFGGERTHEGTDVIADLGVPIYAAGNGVIEKVGWNTLGGWRIGVRGAEGVYYYYAHMSSYYGDINQGATVTKGQLLGFVGSTGYGPVGTDDIMIPHLHFGMYEGAPMSAINAYPFLKHWEKRAG